IPVLAKNKRHTIEAVVDRLVTGNIDRVRLSDSVEIALKYGGGIMVVLRENPDPAAAVRWEEEHISEHLACVDCGISYGELAPRNFSFNSPFGACRRCNGLGALQVMVPELVVPDPELSIRKGAIPGWRRGPRRLLLYYNHLLRCLAEHYDCPDMLTTPFGKLSEKIRHVILYGSGDEVVKFDYYLRGRRHELRKPFEGVLANLERRLTETESDTVRGRLREYMRPMRCPECQGARLNPVSLAVTVGGLSIDRFNSLSIDKALEFIRTLQLGEEQTQIAAEIRKEIESRLRFLVDVGLPYLTLERQSGTLSGGEMQRIRLATQLGCGLVGVLYILDEPSIGLHQRDNDRLLDTLTNLRDIGNTVIVVEHDLDTIRRADHVIDIGPGAGVHGGEVVAAGTPEEVMNQAQSLTGAFLSGRREIAIPSRRCRGTGEWLEIVGAAEHNLKNIDVKIPLGTLCCVTGVSGSGKSTLINEILCRAVERHFNPAAGVPGRCAAVKGMEQLGKMIVIDQSPIGRTPRSNPVTYTDAFGAIRNLFAALPEAKIRGYKPGRFSFNIKGGRCEECQGDGIKKIEMQFLPDVYVTCSACNGKRFNQETLSVYYKKKNIADVLDMTVNQAVGFFDAHPPIYRKLKTLQEVGLGYIHLGQAATTLSGGEAQRVKLARELAKIPRGHTLYILDEPTTGLHSADIEQLLEVLMRLRDKENTVLVIEHNLDVIKVADYLIDLGPEGGDGGGRVVARGTPEEVAACPDSYTGHYLAPLLSTAKAQAAGKSCRGK
ncbi:MAG: excinuclease ABC subunit UvrA, partial [Victivallales bacterium]|nr:excinuclease ABC subunit UvrA [Victivallales bacterium]